MSGVMGTGSHLKARTAPIEETKKKMARFLVHTHKVRFHERPDGLVLAAVFLAGDFLGVDV